MAATRNGKWTVAGVGGVLTILVAAIGILTWFNVPNCGEIVTKVEAKTEHDAIKDDVHRDIEAAAELNAVEHSQFRESFDRQQKATEANQKEIRWMFKRILGEVGKE